LLSGNDFSGYFGRSFWPAPSDQTRVTVEHIGWDTIPQDHVARHRFPDAVFLRRHADWWQLLRAAMGQSVTPFGRPVKTSQL